jgi:hypothetical protein
MRSLSVACGVGVTFLQDESGGSGQVGAHCIAHLLSGPLRKYTGLPGNVIPLPQHHLPHLRAAILFSTALRTSATGDPLPSFSAVHSSGDSGLA